MHKILWDSEIQTNHLNRARRPDLVLINKEKRTCHHMDFDVSGVKIKESKKRDKYLDRAREQKNCRIYGWQWYQM